MSKTIQDCHPKLAGELNAGNVRSIYYELYGSFPNTLYCSTKLLSTEIMDIVSLFVPRCNTQEIIENKYLSEEEGPTNNALIWHLDSRMLLIWKMEMLGSSSSCIFAYAPDREKEVFAISNMIMAKNKTLTENNIKMLTLDYGSYQFDDFKLRHLPQVDLEKHYEGNFVAENQKIQALLNSQKRGLMLFHGVPGTGKTTYLKYLLQTQERKVIFIPTYLVSGLSSPEFVQLLMTHTDSILIIEEGEKVLSNRIDAGSDANAVSTLLNITDGILGDILNLTIICTFNTHLNNIDPALLRKGRLLYKYEFKKLSAQKAAMITGEIEKEPLTLADALFKKQQAFHNSVPAKIGFL